jgi:hypothetical protein
MGKKASLIKWAGRAALIGTGNLWALPAWEASTIVSEAAYNAAKKDDEDDKD